MMRLTTTALCILLGLLFSTLVSIHPVFAAPADSYFEYQISSYDQQLPPSNIADVWGLDGQLISRETVQRLKSEGKYLICYINVGTWDPGKVDVQDWMELDADKHPIPGAGIYPYDDFKIGNALGNEPIWGNRYDVEAFNDEFWWNIFHPAVKAIIDQRIDNCANKGFDVLEPDNIDSHIYEDDTGLPVDPSGFGRSEDDIIEFNKELANRVHAKSLKIFQKNGSDLVPGLVDTYDGAITEGCLANDECLEFQPYVQREKPVYAIEYMDELSQDDFKAMACDSASLPYSYVLKDRLVEPYGSEAYIRQDCRA
jgi:hypothetical protein